MTSGSPAMRLHPPWDCMGESLLLAKPRPGVGLAAVGAAQNTCRWPRTSGPRTSGPVSGGRGAGQRCKTLLVSFHVRICSSVKEAFEFSV